jgi:hypothetical protein
VELERPAGVFAVVGLAHSFFNFLALCSRRDHQPAAGFAQPGSVSSALRLYDDR